MGAGEGKGATTYCLIGKVEVAHRLQLVAHVKFVCCRCPLDSAKFISRAERDGDRDEDGDGVRQLHFPFQLRFFHQRGDKVIRQLCINLTNLSTAPNDKLQLRPHCVGSMRNLRGSGEVEKQRS